jgi:hypothetical protein
LKVQVPTQPWGSGKAGSGGAERIGSGGGATVWVQEAGAWLKTTLWELVPSG